MLNFRTRLVFTHLIVIVAVLTFTAIGADWALSKSIHAQLDAALLALAETEMGMLLDGNNQSVKIHEIPAGPTPVSFVRLDRLVQIINLQGEVLARSSNLGSANLPVSPELLGKLVKGETVFETYNDFGEEPTRMVTIPVHSPRSNLAIQVAGSLDDVRHTVETATLLFILMSFALLIAVAITGTSLTRRAFRAIDNIVCQARRIGEASLSERLPHPGSQDEIGRLVDTLNEMLDRLEQSFEIQRRFTSDASHELRSPLNRLRTELEVTIRRPREVHEYLETLNSCADEVLQMTEIVDELLMLARLDAGLEKVTSEMVSINQLMKEVVEKFLPQATSRQIHISIDSSSNIDLPIASGALRIVLNNLVDNAIKFSPNNSMILIGLKTTDKEAILSVSDQGPGIPFDELPKLFERFYRGTASYSTLAPGTGLGLALSKAIIHAYGGRIEASNILGEGARFSVWIPYST